MDLLSKIKSVGDALAGVSVNVSHYYANKKNDRYIVWAEDGENGGVNSDNAKEHQAIQGTIDLFTKREYDPLADEIQTALDAAGIGYMLSSVVYEDETGFIHYEWVWEVA